MAFNFETELVESISNRCCNLRSNSSFNQDDIADKGAISRIENAKYSPGDNFISHTVLESYELAFNVTKEEIIFGSAQELEELLFDFFYDMFRLVARRDLTVDLDRYKKGAFSPLDIKLQKAVISLANYFAEYNLQRYNFLKTDELFMDCVNKQWDKTVFIGGKPYNIGRICYTGPINEDTVIDIDDMEEKLWLICCEKFTLSFRNYLKNNLFNNFKYSSLNKTIYQWVDEEFINVIVPEIAKKLKSNSIFKIGILVHNLIDDFLNEDLPESYQTTIPLQIERPAGFEIGIDNDLERYHIDTVEQQQERAKIIDTLMRTGKVLDATEEEIESYNKLGIQIERRPEHIETKEVDIDAIIDQAIISRNWGKTTSLPLPSIEMGPIVKTSDFDSFEDMRKFYDDWFDFIHFTHINIPGYFTVNSQIINRWQSRLNVEVREAMETFIIIQNNLLRLVTKDELRRFSK